MAALEAGKHVLCEKPVNHDYLEVVRAADLATSKGLKTKLGFTFRYAPAVHVRRRADRRRLRRHAVHASTRTSRTASGSTRRLRCASSTRRH